jgi:hypothetical protein
MADPTYSSFGHQTEVASAASSADIGKVIPTAGSFGDSREIAAAEAVGLPTPTGTPLSATARGILTDLDKAVTAIHGWAAWIDARVSKVKAMETGSSA